MGQMEDAGTIGFTRRGGIPRINVKSPLFERFFKDVSKGAVQKDKIFGANLYSFPIDESVRNEFLESTSTLLTGGDAFFGIKTDGTPWFNLGFLRAVGAAEGVTFPLHSLFPLKYVENGMLAKNIKMGVSKLLREFISDYEVNIRFAVSSKV